MEKILIPKKILQHKERKVQCRVSRRYLVKFKNYSSLHAKRLEGELADTPKVLKLYLEAFQLCKQL